MKSISDQVALGQNGAHQEADDNGSVSNTDEQNPSTVAAEINEPKLSDASDNGKEKQGVSEGKEVEDEDKIHDAEDGEQLQEAEGEEKSCEAEDEGKSPEAEGEGKSHEADKKLPVGACKDRKDVVMREDLKSVFEKFGSVKVCRFFSSCLGRFVPPISLNESVWLSIQVVLFLFGWALFKMILVISC